MSVTPQCFGALALELAAPPERAVLARDAAEALVTHVANDLLRLLPEVQALDLALAGAHFDPAELLRPGWPRHAALLELLRRAPGARGARVIGLGAHAGAMPLLELMPDPALFGGPLRLLPLVLDGEASQVANVAQAMEAQLLDTGMAGAATALLAQDAFAARVEHARYLSLHDLCAMTAMQYEHAGLAALWPLIEAALLAPDAEESLDEGPEPLLRYGGGLVRLARPSFSAWLEAGMAPRQDLAPTLLRRAFEAHEARLRQFHAVLKVHAIPSEEVVVNVGVDPRDALKS